MTYVTLVPAYGRDYNSKATVLQDWKANKDFRINDISHPDDGRYINLSDAAKVKGVTYNIRYNKLKSVLPVKV